MKLNIRSKAELDEIVKQQRTKKTFTPKLKRLKIKRKFTDLKKVTNKKRKFTKPTFTEVLVTVKKTTHFAGKKPTTVVLWQCRVMQDFLEMFLLNMFVMPWPVYKYVESELEDCGIYTKPAVITNYDYYRRGIKKNRLPKGFKTQSIKTLTIEVI